MSDHPMQTGRGWQRLIRASRYSLQGLRQAWVCESAFRQEIVLASIMLPASIVLGQTWSERVLLAGTVVLVLIVELLNSALEAAVDRVSMDLHQLAGRAKDMGSAAVLLSLLLCGATWATALWSRWA